MPVPPRTLVGVLTAAALGAAMAGCSRTEVTGRVVEYGSGEPIADAVIAVTRRGWGVSGGQLVWDKAYHSETRSDAQGRFALPLPGPSLLTGEASLQTRAAGFQRLSEVPVEAGESVELQTVPAPAHPVPGGAAHIGLLADGTPFGWSFVDNRAVTDLDHVDLYPTALRLSPPEMVLAAPPGGGLAFLSAAAQGIHAVSYGRLLRYAETAPQTGYHASLRLSADTPGTVFVRTRDQRYAKLAFEPARLASGGGLPGTSLPVKAAVSLPFAYNPLPGARLPFDPSSGFRRVDPRHAAVAAQVPADGVLPAVPRSYRLAVRDAAGRTVDALAVRLMPGRPQRLTGCARAEGAYRYELALRYGADGLPRLAVSVYGKGFADHLGSSLVGLRRATVERFSDYGHLPAREYTLSLQELAGKDERPAGCRLPR